MSTQMSELDEAMPDAEAQVRLLEEAARTLEQAPPGDILAWALEQYPQGLVMACSFGMQSVAMLDMLHKLGGLNKVEVFYLDTGVLFSQTHQTRLRLQAKYGFRAVRVAADQSWEDQQAEHGGHLYERGEEGVNLCCKLRKVEPQKKYLKGKRAWITGMRRGHSANRANLPVALWDLSNGMAKFNPVALWPDSAVWKYIHANDVPFNPLYDQGYPSIGCDTPVCTRPVNPGDDPRSGRWAGLGKTECGIHLDGNAIKSLDSARL